MPSDGAMTDAYCPGPYTNNTVREYLDVD